MAMRITTKMMQNTSLNNLNTNKALQDKLTTQLSTMKKITRPSDDPVIAIRSLKLNSTLNKIDQYYEKNAEDAESWLELTESAIKTTNGILEDMRQYITQASQGHLEAKDRAAILENLSNYQEEIYSTGNATSAGRSIFTGYRTNTPLTFLEDKTERYTITEQRNNSYMDTITFVQTGDLAEINEGNFQNKQTNEYGVNQYEVARIRLAYNNVAYDNTAVAPANPAQVGLSYLKEVDDTPLSGTQGVTVSTTSYSVFVAQESGVDSELQITVKDADGNVLTTPAQPMTITKGAAATTIDANTTIEWTSDGALKITEGGTGLPLTTTLNVAKTEADSAGTGYVHTFEKSAETTFNITGYYQGAKDEAYKSVIGDANANNITYVAETGELLLGQNVQAKLAKLTLDDEIRLNYEKTEWKSGDLDPIHYFYTKRYDENRNNREIIYNEEKLTNPMGNTAKQVIEYDIGSNQSIRVNTTADEIYTHDMGRDVGEVVALLEKYDSLDTTYNKVKTLIESGKYEGDDLDKLNQQLDALDKARTLAKNNVQKTCEGMLTTFDGYINQATLARTDVGSLESRLKLIQNRLSAQQTNFQELVSDNEDADVTDLAIQLSSVKLTYDAALSSISYVMQTTLLDFI